MEGSAPAPAAPGGRRGFFGLFRVSLWKSLHTTSCEQDDQPSSSVCLASTPIAGFAGCKSGRRGRIEEKVQESTSWRGLEGPDVL